MSNLEQLKDLVDKEDLLGFLCWLENFALWFDPGGWYDAGNVMKYYLEQGSKSIESEDKKCIEEQLKVFGRELTR